MKRLVLTALVLLAAIPTDRAAGAEPAADERYGQGFGRMYFAWAAPLDPWTNPLAACNDYATNPIPPFREFEWVLAIRLDFADIGLPDQNEFNGVNAWEARVSIPDEIVVTRRRLLPPSSVDVSGPVGGDPNDDNWIVGTGQLVAAEETPYALVQYRGIFYSVSTNKTVRVGPASPCSFSDVGGPGYVPGWVEWDRTGECPHECLRGFQHWDDCEATLTINSTTPCEARCGVGVEASASWGALKSRY